MVTCPVGCNGLGVPRGHKTYTHTEDSLSSILCVRSEPKGISVAGTHEMPQLIKALVPSALSVNSETGLERGERIRAGLKANGRCPSIGFRTISKLTWLRRGEFLGGLIT
ncbi:hypothetical protein BJX63DRAFT_212040 [Aspergillus granulosus]|uniref:Ig-like domain-containing protein n=1 Tax=Aspergillus granulosus TaxID=176169 RepID=A0ABR4HEW2_9EURO